MCVTQIRKKITFSLSHLLGSNGFIPSLQYQFPTKYPLASSYNKHWSLTKKHAIYLSHFRPLFYFFLVISKKNNLLSRSSCIVILYSIAPSLDQLSSRTISTNKVRTWLISPNPNHNLPLLKKRNTSLPELNVGQRGRCPCVSCEIY